MRRNALLFSLLALALCVPGLTQTPAAAPPVIGGPPDVLVLVYQRPGLGDQVDITYARTIPRDQATRDIQALIKETGWVIPSGSIKDGTAPVHSKFGAMTSVAFTAPNVVQDSTHTLPMETFTRAFRNYKRLNLVFIVSSGFTFQGTRQSADNHLQFTLDQHGAAYTYQIAILDPNFDGFSRTPSGAVAGQSRRAAPWLIFLGILALAALVGAAVFVLTTRLTRSTGSPPSAQETEKSSEEKESSEEPIQVGTGR